MTEEKDRHLYTDAEVANMVGLCKTKWTSLKKAGLTPKALKLPGSRDLYTIEAIDVWRSGNRQAS